MPFRLCRAHTGYLALIDASGKSYENVVPVRAFPVTSPESGFSLIGPAGEELAWIDRLDTLPEDTRALIREELAGREFMPEILRITGVSSYATPCVWEIETDRGATRLLLGVEEDIRRLTPPALMITDRQGIHYLIRDSRSLDRQSRKYLDRFL
ncbi:MAG: DUF1854 domain-containing protein [Candidatus Accumulibacter sp.]|nr:DUF1854 domain-containing protein [Accumulibacter sp.]